MVFDNLLNNIMKKLLINFSTINTGGGELVGSLHLPQNLIQREVRFHSLYPLVLGGGVHE